MHHAVATRTRRPGRQISQTAIITFSKFHAIPFRNATRYDPVRSKITPDIRKLVEDARRSGEDKDRIRQAREAAYRFMSAMAGNAPHYEEAIRALFADEPAAFEKLIAEWPEDVRDHASMLAESAFRREPQARTG